MDGMGQIVSSSKNNVSWNSENKSKLNGFPMTHPWDDCTFTYTFTKKNNHH